MPLGYKQGGGGVEGCFPLISITNTVKVIGVTEVQLGEYGGFVKRIKGSVDQRQWICVFHCDLVECLEINAGAQGAVLLPDKEESCPYRGR